MLTVGKKYIKPCPLLPSAFRLYGRQENRVVNDLLPKEIGDTHETHNNGGTDAQSRCCKHLRARQDGKDDFLGKYCGHYPQSTARHSYGRRTFCRQRYAGTIHLSSTTR